MNGSSVWTLTVTVSGDDEVGAQTLRIRTLNFVTEQVARLGLAVEVRDTVQRKDDDA